MRAVGNRRGTRTISLALAAGSVAFEIVLALSAGAVGIPGVFLVRFADAKSDALTDPGGESVVAKQPVAVPTPEVAQLDTPPLITSSVAPAAVPVPESPQTAGPLDLTTVPDLDPATEANEEEAASKKPAIVPAAQSTPTEVLPWDEIEPEPFTPNGPTRSATPDHASAAPAPVQLPAGGDAQGWVRSKASTVAGGVDEHGRPLYRFELWVEPPAEVKQRLVAVAYDFDAPSAEPRTQESTEQQTGFRVRFGGLACADKITLTLKFDDGQQQQVAVNGCKISG
jgi:hypothetical protein